MLTTIAVFVIGAITICAVYSYIIQASRKNKCRDFSKHNILLLLGRLYEGRELSSFTKGSMEWKIVDELRSLDAVKVDENERILGPTGYGFDYVLLESDDGRQRAVENTERIRESLKIGRILAGGWNAADVHGTYIPDGKKKSIAPNT